MPTRTRVDTGAPSLVELVAEAEAAGEVVVQIVQAGNSWVLLVDRPSVKTAQARPRKPIAR